MTREEAINFLYSIAGDLGFTGIEDYTCKDGEKMREAINTLEQEHILDKIRAEINSPNRGTCDYFIVDRIEEIIDKYKAESVEQEPCEDAISRQAVRKEILGLWNSSGDKDYCMETLRDFVVESPPVIPQPKSGHWETICNGIEYDWGTYNKCKARIPMTYKYYEFCPHCGADMREVEKND